MWIPHALERHFTSLVFRTSVGMCLFGLQNIGMWSKVGICSIRNSLTLPLLFILFSILTLDCSSHSPGGHWHTSYKVPLSPEISISFNPAFLYSITPTPFSHLIIFFLSKGPWLQFSFHSNRYFLPCHTPFSPSLNWIVSWYSQPALIPKPTSKYIPSNFHNNYPYALPNAVSRVPKDLLCQTSVLSLTSKYLTSLLHLTTSFLKLNSIESMIFYSFFFTYFKTLTIFLDFFCLIIRSPKIQPHCFPFWKS